MLEHIMRLTLTLSSIFRLYSILVLIICTPFLITLMTQSQDPAEPASLNPSDLEKIHGRYPRRKYENVNKLHRSRNIIDKLQTPLGVFCVTWNAYYPYIREYDENTVTFASHGSVDHLIYLTKLDQLWNGPISMALFLTSDLSDLLNDASNLLSLSLSCSKSLHKKLTLHVFYPFSKKCDIIPVRTRTECDEFQYLVDKIGRSTDANLSMFYPMNIGRNVAVKRIYTTYHISADIEMLPSAGLAEKFQQFYLNNRDLLENTVYVVPKFELHPNTPFNYTFEALSQLLSERKAAFQFHYFIARRCHAIPNLPSWIEASGKDSKLRVLETIKWIRPCWEPAFFAKTTVPKYDERFSSYGYDRTSMVYELCRADYKFRILTRGFLVHSGIKHDRKKYENFWKPFLKNQKLFKEFSRELDEKYPRKGLIEYCDAKRDF